MLEIEMEEAVSTCPDLFIEPGLRLVRRQAYINGRRPDILFTDAFSRHLLVELQRGRLDEDHLQRHFYYFYDYRAKYPSSHPRLMFIANRLVPQHKQFIDESGYEFREIPESDFERRITECRGREHAPAERVEVVTTPGVLPPETCQLLYEIETQPMVLCYKMLLLIAMAELADANGRVALTLVAERFKSFFLARAAQGKTEENPNIIKTRLSSKSTRAWASLIRRQPVHYFTDAFVIDEGTTVRWVPRIWTRWDGDLKNEILAACQNRLARYFEKYAGGY